MKIQLDLSSIADYEKFIRIKSLPTYKFVGRTAIFPDEYASRLELGWQEERGTTDYQAIPGLFDYQRDIARLSIHKRKFAVFADPGLGKTLMMLEFARHAQHTLGPTRRVLIVSPLMVIPQTIAEMKRFYGSLNIPDFGLEPVAARDLPRWVQDTGSFVGITNYEALKATVSQGRIGALICDESSQLKSAYGKHARELIRLGAGINWKLCLTGTPAPNDRIEYGNHSVFLDAFPTINSFLARFFVNRGQTNERWEMKPHALGPFYRALSHWCIFLSNPATYGWSDNVSTIPPIHIHIHNVDLTAEQRSLVGSELGTLFVGDIGGITSRSKLSQIAKGHHNGQKIATHKPEFIRRLVESWPDESTIIWCLYDEEQAALEKVFPDAASIKGSTPIKRRMELIADFQAGRRKIMISKTVVLGYGLNLQICTRQIFSGLQDSYESFFQAVKRSNRVGSTRPLNVHIPVTDAEIPMVETVLRKAKRVQEDTDYQEQLFKQELQLGGMVHVA
jgi:superfamily II DNA or RNA helicase